MEKLLSKKLHISEEVKTLQAAPIFKLTDECLYNIFKFLTIKDRIVIERGKHTYL